MLGVLSIVLISQRSYLRLLATLTKLGDTGMFCEKAAEAVLTDRNLRVLNEKDESESFITDSQLFLACIILLQLQMYQCSSTAR